MAEKQAGNGLAKSLAVVGAGIAAAYLANKYVTNDTKKKYKAQALKTSDDLRRKIATMIQPAPVERLKK